MDMNDHAEAALFISFVIIKLNNFQLYSSPEYVIQAMRTSGSNSLVKSQKKRPLSPGLINTVSVSNLVNHFFGNFLRIFPHLQTNCSS